jgi:ubiquinol-cytochrome c reductase iron-sulfur subunit
MNRRPISLALAFSAAASVALAVVFLAEGSTPLQGALLAMALAGIGSALVMRAHTLGDREVTEHRSALGTPPSSTATPAEGPTRRSFIRWLFAAFAALGVALITPIRSLGRTPSGALRHTNWAAGTPLVDASGERMTVGSLKVGGVETVFPEGHVGDAISQALLLRIDPTKLHAAPGRQDWSHEGYIVFSKVCTHAGCPVGLFENTSDQLLCPCHQSTFDVLHAAQPVFGPAPRPLPQLPITATSDGVLVASSDFNEPIGPGFWSRGR